MTIEGTRPRRASTASIAGTALAVAIGLWGPWRITSGQATVVIYGPVGREGWRTILVISLAWAVVVTVLRARPIVTSCVSVAAVVVAGVATADDVGRSIGVTALAGVIVAYAALVAWAPLPGWPERGRQVAWAAVPVIVGAEVVWVSGRLPVAVLLLVLALGVVEAHHRTDRFERIYSAAERSAGRRWGRAAVVRNGRVAVRSAASAVARWWRLLVRLAGIDRASALAALVSVGLMVPVWVRLASDSGGEIWGSDWPVHVDGSRLITWWPFDPVAPHPVFHLGVRLLGPMLGFPTAAVVVTSLAVAATSVAVVRLIRMSFAGRPGVPIGAVASISVAVGYLLLESPALVARALDVGNRRDWAPMVHQYLSPTDTVGVPFSLALLAFTGRVVGSPPGSRWRTRNYGIALALTLVVATLAKPSMAIVLLPAVPLHLVVTRSWDRGLVGFLARWFVVPALLVLAVQTWMVDAGGSAFEEGGLAVDPMWTIEVLGLHRSGPLLLAAMFVLVLCASAGWRRFQREPMVALNLWGLLVGLVLLAMFRETGGRSGEGTFAKPALMAAATLLVLAWRYLLGEWWALRSERSRPPAWVWVTTAFLALSLIAGVASYLDLAGWVTLPIPTRGPAG